MSALLALSVCGCSKFLDVNPKVRHSTMTCSLRQRAMKMPLYGIYSRVGPPRRTFTEAIWCGWQK